MLNSEFVIVDVFTDRALAGNPLAVFPNADGLDETTMQSIAREFHFSETSFVLAPRDRRAHRRLRCFSPSAEVYGAGHNALGAWWVILGRASGAASEVVWQELGDRLLPLEVTRVDGVLHRLAMTQAPPVLAPVPPGLSGLAPAFGLRADALSPTLEACVATTGATSHLLVPMRGLDDLLTIRVDPGALAAVARPLGCEGCYAFSLESLEAESVAHARGFFPGIGIEEDPATGSAAGPLVVYLRAHGLAPADTWVHVEQGDGIHRPSRIQVRVSADRVEIGGRCAVVGHGRLTL